MMVVNGFSCVIGYEQAMSWSIDYAVVMLLEYLLDRSKCLLLRVYEAVPNFLVAFSLFNSAEWLFIDVLLLLGTPCTLILFLLMKSILLFFKKLTMF